MDGGLTVEKGDLYGLIALCLANYQSVRVPWLWRFRDRLRMTLRRLLQTATALLDRNWGVALRVEQSGRLELRAALC